MDALDQLELVGLVSRVVSELQNHLGIVDKTLAEFIIAQRLECSTVEKFTQKMIELAGDSFTPSLIESIDRLVQAMHPAFKGRPTTANPSSAEEKLALKSLTAKPNAIDIAMASLEALEPNDRTRSQMRGPEIRGQSPSARKKRADPDGRRIERYKEHDEARPKDYGQLARRVHDRPNPRGDCRDEKWEEVKPSPAPVTNDKPILYKIYEGRITGIKKFGVFVNLQGVEGKVDGLVHVSQLADSRVNHPSDMFQHGQHVKVKVISIHGNRIGLSIKDADQGTGQDVASNSNPGSGANLQALGEGSSKNTPRPQALHPAQRRTMTSPERWEMRQLIASGVAKASDYPEFEGYEDTSLDGGIKLDEEVDVEIRDECPPFLAGQLKRSLELSPIRIVRVPEGSMNRAAMSGAALAKEWKELQQQETEATAVSTEERQINSSAPSNDSMEDGKSFKLNISKTDRMRQKDQVFGTRTDLTIKDQRESLPVYAFRDQLIDAVRNYQVLVVIGETGSGKTTQITQYLAEAGLTNEGIIGCTQPRRVAAMSVAKRVAEEVGCVLGEEVGYSVRFDDCTTPLTKIKYMTDGMLQREVLLDPELQKYSVIMLDEAHERTIATDVLFTLIKRILKKRSDLKLIVTSATLDADKFSTYFDDAPIFSIPGRTFPVEILYSREPEPDYLDAALTTIPQVHLTEPAGDILVFLTGQEEIDTSCEILRERMKSLGSVPELIVLPIYSALPSEMQRRIFEPTPTGSRKVILATNIAETSITIDNIYYVIDPGFVKQSTYDPKLGLDSLTIAPISQAQANQRAGRAGRTGPGKCFRLYTEAAFQSEMLSSPIPDIQRQNLSTMVLMLKAIGIDDLLHCDFMDLPPVNTMITALEDLYALGALDDEGLLTQTGRRIAEFPLEPSLAKVLIRSAELGCSEEVLSIISMLQLTEVFYRPKDKQKQSDQKRTAFNDPSGDHLTLLNVYRAWEQSGHSTPWCFENYIHARSMRRAKDVREQLVNTMKRFHHPVVSCGNETELIRRALCCGFFRNAGRRDKEGGGYKTLTDDTPVYMHPSSALFGRQAEWVVYHEVVLTTREYMRWTTAIEPRWLVDAAPTFFKVAGTDGNMSKRRKKETIQPLHNKYAGQNDWRLSSQKKGGRRGGTWG